MKPIYIIKKITEEGSEIKNIIESEILAEEYAEMIDGIVERWEIDDEKIKKELEHAKVYYQTKMVVERVLEDFAILPYWKTFFSIETQKKYTLNGQLPNDELKVESWLYEEPIMTYKAIFTKKREMLTWLKINTDQPIDNETNKEEQYKKKMMDILKEIERLEKEERWKIEKINQYLQEKYT